MNTKYQKIEFKEGNFYSFLKRTPFSFIGACALFSLSTNFIEISENIKDWVEAFRLFSEFVYFITLKWIEYLFSVKIDQFTKDYVTVCFVVSGMNLRTILFYMNLTNNFPNYDTNKFDFYILMSALFGITIWFLFPLYLVTSSARRPNIPNDVDIHEEVKKSNKNLQERIQSDIDKGKLKDIDEAVKLYKNTKTSFDEKKSYYYSQYNHFIVSKKMVTIFFETAIWLLIIIATNYAFVGVESL